MFKKILTPWFDLTAVFLLVCALTRDSDLLTNRFMNREDLPVLAGILVLGFLVRFMPGVDWLAGWLSRRLSGLRVLRQPLSPAWRWRTVLILALGAGLAGWLGLRFVYLGYPLSMDEFMATFDAAIFRHGELMATIPAQWRVYVDALQPLFVQHLGGGAFWVSGYLPVSAALRALGGLAGGASLVNPILTAISVVAVFGVGRRMWPQRPGLALAAALLLATSSQVLVGGMGAYAMPAHLAFNLVWLWLFLRGGWLGHAGALAVGFLACGLHQLPFHPLFVAPFVAQLWLERRWRAAALYTVAYAAICLFWVEYWQIALATAQAGPAAPATAAAAAKQGAMGFYDQAQLILKDFEWSGVALMAKNLIRFATWQNPLTAPLLLLSAWGAFRAKGTTRSLILGFVTTLAAVFALMPYQGHGWGYRYVHGLLGSACLLAAWQWGRMTDPLSPAQRAGARGGFALAAAAALLILFPLRAWQAHRFAHPYALAAAAIRAAPTDFVLVDDRNVWFGVDLVRNDPYLRNRPLILHAEDLEEDQARALCARGTISMFDSSVARRFGILRFNEYGTDADAAQLADDMHRWTCHGAPVRLVTAVR